MKLIQRLETECLRFRFTIYVAMTVNLWT